MPLDSTTEEFQNSCRMHGLENGSFHYMIDDY